MPRISLSDIVPKLIAQTEKGVLRWSPTADENAFRVAFPGGLVRVETSQNRLYRLVFQDADGNTIDSVAEQLDSSIAAAFARTANIPPPPEVARLYMAARRSALQLDDRLEKLLVDVEQGHQVETPYDKDDPEWKKKKGGY